MMYRWTIIKKYDNSWDDFDDHSDFYEDVNPDEELEYFRNIYYEGEFSYSRYSRGSKADLRAFLRDIREYDDGSYKYYGIWLPYNLVGYSEKAKNLICKMAKKELSDAIIAYQLNKMGLKECVDWKWEFDEDKYRENLCDGGYDDDWEMHTYLEMGGDIEKYNKHGFDDWWDSRD